jgi:N6-L-threonylcarbamoyladenine synthase
VIGGGVACNQGLRRSAAELGLGLPVWFASPALSTDNAAMIAAAAYPKLLRGEFSDFTLRASASLKLA